jgi:two-component system, OmpR family, response regulator
VVQQAALFFHFQTHTMIPKLQRILYVDDQQEVLQMATLAMVKHGGFDVQACSSGEQALAVASDYKPDLLLLDVMMPGMDGPTTLKHLRASEQTATTPAIFFTAHTAPADIAKYLAAGAIDLIPKPFDPMTLAGSIRAIWAWHHLRLQQFPDQPV